MAYTIELKGQRLSHSPLLHCLYSPTIDIKSEGIKVNQTISFEFLLGAQPSISTGKSQGVGEGMDGGSRTIK